MFCMAFQRAPRKLAMCSYDICHLPAITFPQTNSRVILEYRNDVRMAPQYVATEAGSLATPSID
jgi:hypothetical protein